MKNYENSKRNSISNNQQGISNVQRKKIWLKIIMKAEMIKAASQLITLLQETDELIAILFTGVETAKRRKGNRLSCPWQLDLSVGYWILKMGENAGLVVTP
ncbi:MAG: hypothetical protein JRJ06_05395 [Deltaproteobacteria bacterium]|nr:hypothetical protein [Deltaproteobacteria bacterium]